MVDVAQLVSAPDCGSGGRGFESLHPPHSFKPRLWRGLKSLCILKILGCRQAVRQRTLTPSRVGSNPAIPAKYDPLAQSAEHLPFKQGVRSSNLRRVTKNSECECIRNFYLFPIHYSLFTKNALKDQPETQQFLAYLQVIRSSFFLPNLVYCRFRASGSGTPGAHPA